jgi:hypothetical protein
MTSGCDAERLCAGKVLKVLSGRGRKGGQPITPMCHDALLHHKRSHQVLRSKVTPVCESTFIFSEHVYQQSLVTSLRAARSIPAIDLHSHVVCLPLRRRMERRYWYTGIPLSSVYTKIYTRIPSYIAA